MNLNHNILNAGARDFQMIEFQTSFVNTLALITTGLVIIVIAHRWYVIYTHNNLLNRMVETRLVRAEEGQAIDLTLTAEEFRDQPELIEIFGQPEGENGLNINLETQQELEFIEFQVGLPDPRNILEITGDHLMELIEALLDGQLPPGAFYEALPPIYEYIFSIF